MYLLFSDFFKAVNNRLVEQSLPLWGRCPSVHTGADEVGTHQSIVPTPNKKEKALSCWTFCVITLYAHTILSCMPASSVPAYAGPPSPKGKAFVRKTIIYLKLPEKILRIVRQKPPLNRYIDRKIQKEAGRWMFCTYFTATGTMSTDWR